MSCVITFCMNELCQNTKCERHMTRAPKDIPISIAALYGSEYCEETKVRDLVIVKKSGYKFVQVGGKGDHHITISRNGKMIMHIEHTGGMLERSEAMEMFERYINFLESR